MYLTLFHNFKYNFYFFCKILYYS